MYNLSEIISCLDYKSKEEAFADLRTYEGLSDCDDKALEHIIVRKWEAMNGPPKTKDLDRGKRMVENAHGTLGALNDMLHLIMTPSLDQDLGLERISEVLKTMTERIDRQDTMKVNKKTGPITPIPEYTTTFVDTVEGIENVVNDISEMRNDKEAPIIFIDLEGFNLGRNGTFSIFQIYISSSTNVYIIDILTLRDIAFTTPSSSENGATLKTIFEGTGILKAFWDCRSDSDALLFHHGIRLDACAVVDIQLLDVATVEKSKDRKKLFGLMTALEKRINLPQYRALSWAAVKQEYEVVVKDGPNWREKTAQNVAKAEQLFQKIFPDDGSPASDTSELNLTENVPVDDGWNTAVAWEQRPLPDAMFKYAAGDVVVLPLLYHSLVRHPRLSVARKRALQEETARRVRGAQAKVLAPTGAVGPEGWSSQEW